MLKAKLEKLDRHLRPTFPNTHAGAVNFDENLYISNELMALVTGNIYRSYYLPRHKNTGLYIDPPVHPTRNNPALFLAANLTDCCVGIQSFGGFIRVRNYNLYTTGNHNPVFSQDDLFRYGTNVS